MRVMLGGYVSFGDICRKKLFMLCQYGSAFLGKDSNRPNFGADLRIKGDVFDYHSLMIHKDDVATFVLRVQRYRQTNAV